jgi:autotransporter-associated beta strand protein
LNFRRFVTTGASAQAEIHFNGAKVVAGTSAGADFLNALSGMTAWVKTGGLWVDTGTGTNDVVIAANLLDGGGNGGLIKTGARKLILRGANTYKGTNRVVEGALVVGQTNFTATITSTNLSVILSNTPSVGNTFAILPGPLEGSYGTPTVNPLGTGQTASFDSATGILTILQGLTGPSGLSYSVTSVSGNVGTAITDLTPTVTGAVETYAVDPTLPAGLSIHPSTGVIGGTPTEARTSQDYTVTASHSSGGSTTTTISIAVGKGTPVVSVWPTASQIVEGQTLAASALGGGSGSPTGTFAWAFSSMVPVVGTSSHTVIFTPDDPANYNTASTSLSVTVKSKLTDWLQGQETNSVNLGKYAIGGATDINGASERPTSSIDATKLSLMAIVRTNDTNLTIVGEAGGSLTNWSSLGVTSASAASQDGVANGCERRVFSVERTNHPMKLFLRLKAFYP